MRVWLVRLAWLMAAAGLGVLSWLAGHLGQHVLDDHALDDVVVAVALDWRDFGRETAEARLDAELRGIGLAERAERGACQLEARGARRDVLCDWTVEVRLPWTDAPWPVRFESHAGIDAGGALVRGRPDGGPRPAEGAGDAR